MTECKLQIDMRVSLRLCWVICKLVTVNLQSLSAPLKAILKRHFESEIKVHNLKSEIYYPNPKYQDAIEK